MLANIGLYSYGAAVLIYALLGVQVFLGRHNRSMATPLLAAIVLTVTWAGVVEDPYRPRPDARLTPASP